MEYNSQRTDLPIREYGRHIHKMVKYVSELEDKEERNRGAKAIIEIMGRLNPHLRDVEDYTHKLWDHLFIMADFKLDVDSPYPIPSRESFDEKPELVSYPTKGFKYQHYGNILEKLVKKVADYESKEEKEAAKEILANMMKLSYLRWNRDTVKDELILDQMKELSAGKLSFNDETELRSTQSLLKSTGTSGRRKQKNNGQKSYQKKSHKQRKRY